MDVPSGKFQWLHMGNHPVEGHICFPGDVDELPAHDGRRLAEAGLVVQVSDDIAEQDALRPEPSRLIGINTTEEEEIARARAASDISGTLADATSMAGDDAGDSPSSAPRSRARASARVVDV